MPTKNSHITAKPVNVSERPFVIGRDELMGYLGVESYSTLCTNYLNRGLHFDYRIGAKEYFLKASVEQWLVEHTDRWIDVPTKKVV